MRVSSIAVWGAFLALFMLAIVARYVLKSWLAPGAFFALYWSAASFIPFLVLPDDEIRVEAVLWIFFAALAVFAGSILGLRSTIDSTPRYMSRGFSFWQGCIIKIVIVMSLFLGLGVVFFSLRSAGYGLRSLLSPTSLVTVANWFSKGRYLETYTPSLLSQLLLVFVYIGPMFGGLWAAVTYRWDVRLLSALSLLPAVMIMVVRTQRGVLIVAGIFWLSAYLAVSGARHNLILFTKQRILLGLLSIPLAMFIFALVALAREGSTDTDLLPLLFRKVVSGAAGHMPAFSIWFRQEGFRVTAPSWGQITFAGIYNALGIYERQLGLFQEFILLRSGFTTNVYTIFRPLIMDFTIYGAIMALFAFGFLAGVAYQLTLRRQIVAIPIMTAFYATVMFSFNSSIWIWSTVLLGFWGYIAALWFLKSAHRQNIADLS